MSDLRELYQEVILDHNKRPRNFRTIEAPSRVAKGHNPLCGDRLTLYVIMDGDRIADVAFEGSGCAISKASASLMTEAVKGKTVAEAEALFDRFHDLGDLAAGRARDHERPRQAGRVRRRARVSRARQVRQPRLAHDEECRRGSRRGRQD